MSAQGELGPRVEELFHRAVTLDPEQRGRFLDRQCREDHGLRRQLEELLAADGDLGTTWPGLNALPSPPAEPVPEIPGYRDLSLLGRGGMGTVYLGHRHDRLFDGRRFAIKVLHAHRVGRRARRRFDMERRLLAGLDHSSIVRLYDGGTLADGRPFLVMDHVDGRPLDVHCREERLTVEARLRLFLAVCGALHYAHQNLVVHRDLKPSNILVDTDGVPHLLDFGIAKRLRGAEGAAREGEPSVTRTTVGGWLVPMTPAYASPEQVAGQPVTTASDIYALGVLLFELLTDRLPDPPPPDGRPRADAPRPSTQVTDPELATARRATPTRLRRALEGDLDQIVAKALRAEPAARYASARELAEDVERHLSHRPVLARRGSWRYLVGRFVRRHRLGVAVACSGLLVLASAIAAGVQSRRLAEARIAEARSERLIRRLVGPEADLLIGEGELDRTVARIVDLDLPDDAKHLLLDAVRRLHLPEDQLFERALAVVDAEARTGSHDTELAEVALVLGELLFHKGRFETAGAMLARTIGLAEAAHGRDAHEVAPPLEAFARTLSELERYDEGIAALRRAILLRRGADAPPEDLALPFSSLATLLYLRGSFVESADACRQGLALLDRLEGDDDPSLRASLASSLSVALLELDERDPTGEAERYARRALDLHLAISGPGHMHTLTARNNLAVVLGRSGRVEQSLAASVENLEMAETTLGRDHPRLGYILTAIAAAHRELGQPEQCVDVARRAVAVRERGLPPESWLTALSKTVLADCLGRLGRSAEAIPLLRTSIDTFERSKVEDPARLASARARLAELTADQGADGTGR